MQKDHKRFVSSRGVGIQDFKLEKPWRPPSLVLEVDPPEHTKNRRFLTRALSPNKISQLKDFFKKSADKLIRELLEKKEIDFLFDQTQQKVLELSINLQKKEINYGEKTISFNVEKHLIDRIIYGLDDVDITLKEKDKIFDFEKTRIKERPWIFK